SASGAYVALLAVGGMSGLFSGGVDRTPARHVVVRDPTWRALSPWQPKMRGLLGPASTAVNALHTHDGALYAGGYFEYAAAPPGWSHTGPLVRWTGEGWESLDL